MKHPFFSTSVLLGLTLGAGMALAADSGCPICDCNTQSTRCILSCQNTSDFVRRQQCQISCDKNFSICLDAAYKAISAAEEQNNLQTTSVTTTSVTR
ncbi:MAG: hypothetical protein RDU30_10740 [Desulfovibrionaceae bacterium]|nr:hypothetical protein [Desulfovibrionaceae bacterium]